MSTTSASARAGSTQMNVPLWPKCPNVASRVRCAPVQCGDFASRSSKPSPQSQGFWRPKPGSTPTSPGKATVVARPKVVAATTSVGCEQLRDERGAVGERCRDPPEAGEPSRLAPAISERLEDRLAQVVGETACPARRRRGRRAARSRRSSRCARVAGRGERRVWARPARAPRRARAGARASNPAGRPGRRGRPCAPRRR